MPACETNKLLNVAIFFIPLLAAILVVAFKKNRPVSVETENCAPALNRAVAFSIDIAVCFLILYCVLFVLEKISLNLSKTREEVLFFLIMWLYFSVFESSKIQATFGKFSQEMVITDLNGKRITFLRSSARFFCTLISDIPLFIGHLMIVFTKYHQGLHDMLTDTLVIHNAVVSKPEKRNAS
ncbi:RDD family protein [Desulfosarcina sp. OttesenSCG-928-B08]|nr:RDD family protein [Desulfosarcina sp. OttesenSCG-928-B08]